MKSADNIEFDSNVLNIHYVQILAYDITGKRKMNPTG